MRACVCVRACMRVCACVCSDDFQLCPFSRCDRTRKLESVREGSLVLLYITDTNENDSVTEWLKGKTPGDTPQ